MNDPLAKRRLSRKLDNLPGLFDDFDIDRPDIAAHIITQNITPRPKPTPDDDLAPLAAESLTPEPSLRLMSFGSGSSGNCTYVGNNHSGVLIDAGVDNKFVTEQLLHNGIDIASVSGILLTHDHSDHVKYAYPLLRLNRHMRIFCTPKTLNGLLRRHNISRRIKDYHTPIYKEFPTAIGSLTVTAFEVSHDGTDNVGFAIESNGIKLTVVTDTGHITPRADFYMRSANALMIEANYDAQMLRQGPYPEHLKARIASPIGHLDNALTAAHLAAIQSPTLTHIFLCHLSHDNNTPQTALQTVGDALTAAGASITPTPGTPGTLLTALPRFATSPLYTIKINTKNIAE